MTSDPSNSACQCTIVVPFYNEEHRLRPEPFFGFLASANTLHRAVRFLFVDDGSTDNTLNLLKAMQLRAAELGHEGRITILEQRPNGGKAEAIRNGMLAAISAHNTGCEYTGFWDADLATPLSAIPQLLAQLEAGPHLHMIFGSRVRLLGRRINRIATRHYLGRIFATAASQTLRLPIYDTQCGAKIFKITPDLAHVLAHPFISRWIFDVEIVARYIQLRGRDFCFSSIYEFPLEAWEDVGGSKLRSHDFLHAAFDIFRIHRRYLARGVKGRAVS